MGKKKMEGTKNATLGVLNTIKITSLTRKLPAIDYSGYVRVGKRFFFLRKGASMNTSTPLVKEWMRQSCPTPSLAKKGEE